MDKLPINLDDLIHSKSIEDVRIDYKIGWSPKIEASVIKTICAFANDLMNLNGGYIILGIEAPDGKPILPPDGISPEQLEKIQQAVRIACKTKINPEYQPLVVTDEYSGKSIVIIWAPAGDNRPYQAPSDRNPKEKYYYVRLGPESVRATGEVYRQLMEQTARIPFDDRRSLEASILDISPILVKRFLQEIRSDLQNTVTPLDDIELYKALRLVQDVGGILVPRNIALLFFNELPDKFFTGAKFEVVQFGDDSGGDLIEEKTFQGPVDRVIVEVLNYLDNLTSVQLRKVPHNAKVERTVAYPYEALEEAIVNAAYHRSYDNTPDPNKIYLYPDRIEIISYPGPVAGVTLEHLQAGQRVPPVPARNRRIGEILKELRLAEMRGTGIPKIRRTMLQNGSPDPSFDFDKARTYFRAVLPAHPKYLIVHSLRESSYLWSIGKLHDAANRLRQVFERHPGSGAIAGKLIEQLYDLGEFHEAERVFERFHSMSLRSEVEVPYLQYFKILLSNGDKAAATKIIQSLPEDQWFNDPVEVAVAFKRLKLYDRAHPIFARVYSLIDSDPIHLHDYAQTKIEIANQMARKRKTDWVTVNKLRNEAIELLRRAIQLLEGSGNNVELAWCWFDMARTMQYGRARGRRPYPQRQIEEAYNHAVRLLPNEQRFQEAYRRWKQYQSRKQS